MAGALGPALKPPRAGSAPAPGPLRVTHYCPIRESSLSATIHCTRVCLISALAPCPFVRQGVRPCLWIPNLSEPRGPTRAPPATPRPLHTRPRPAPSLVAPNLPEVLSAQPSATPLPPAPSRRPPLPVPIHTSLTENKRTSQTPTCSGPRPRAPSGRLLPARPQPAPANQKAGACPVVRACTRWVGRPGAGHRLAGARRRGSGSPAIAWGFRQG